MRNLRFVVRALLGSALVALAAGCATSGGPRDLPIVDKWNGDYPVAELDRLPDDHADAPVGAIGDAETFADVWDAFMPATKIPTIDFDKNLIVFVRNVQFYNRVNIGKATLDDGVVEIVAMQTMSAIPIEDKVAMSLALIPRLGVDYLRMGDTKVPVPKSPPTKRRTMGY